MKQVMKSYIPSKNYSPSKYNISDEVFSLVYSFIVSEHLDPNGYVRYFCSDLNPNWKKLNFRLTLNICILEGLLNIVYVEDPMGFDPEAYKRIEFTEKFYDIFKGIVEL